MKIDIRPLAEVDAALVRDYLEERGTPRDVVDWKYFDPYRAAGSVRGYCWMRGGRVQGFLGIIPFVLRTDDGDGAAAWTCDWSVRDPQANPGAGILLLRHATAKHERLFAFAGNEQTHRLLPRAARQTFESAGVTLHLPLRLGVAERALAARLPRLPRALARLARVAGGIRLRRRPRVDGDRVVAHAGLPGSLDGMLEGVAGGHGPRPWYDSGHLRWLLERCPGLEVWTFFCPSGAGRAVGFAWRSGAGGRYWRLALLGDPGSGEASDIVRAAHAHADRLGAYALTTIVSERSAAARALFRSAGYREAGARKPLFVCSLPADEELAEPFGELNHFATDLAHRF